MAETTEEIEETSELAGLTGLERATLLLLSLREEVAAEVMSKLDASDIQQLTGCATRLPTLEGDAASRVLEKFMLSLVGGEQISGRQSRDKIRNILTKFLPGDQIEEYMEQLASGVDLSEGFQAIQYVDAETLTAFIKGEHPQTIALILAHLPVDKSAKILSLLSPELQSEVVMRISELDRISPQMVRDIQEVFVNEIIASGASKSRQVGGFQSVAELMNQLDSQAVQSIFSGLEESNPSLCEEIRQLMFVFSDLTELDDRSLQSIIKEVTNETITLALKTASEDMKAKIFKNISSRAAELIEEELEVMGPVKLADVEAAQQEIVGIARRLEEEGKIVLGGGGSEALV